MANLKVIKIQLFFFFIFIFYFFFLPFSLKIFNLNKIKKYIKDYCTSKFSFGVFLALNP